MEQSVFWEADSFSNSQEIPRNLWNPKFRYNIRKSLPLKTILTRMNPVRALPPYLLKIHF
jgi:hypothetical protein